MNETVHYHFMCIMSEMTVIYFDHYHTLLSGDPRGDKDFHPIERKMDGTRASYEAFCGNVRRYLNQPMIGGQKVAHTATETFLSWLQMELETEYGLSDDLAETIILDFFNDCFYIDIYTMQKVMNDYLFPTGYYKTSRNMI